MTKKELLKSFLDGLKARGITPENVTKEDVKDIHLHTSYNNGKVKDPCIDMIAGLTCDPNLPCYKDCYAKHGRMAMPHNKNLRYGNLLLWKGDPKRYEREAHASLMLARHARWNADGDMPDRGYLQMVRRIGKKVKTCRMWFMTKKYKMLNQEIAENGMFPKNVQPMLSAWGDFIPDNPFNLPIFYVRLKNGRGADKIPAGTYECPHDCDICKKIKRGCPYGESVVIDQHR